MTQSNRMVRGELGGRGARNRGRSVQGSPVGSVSVASELGSHFLRTSRGFGGCQARGPQGDWARSPFLRSSQSEGELGTESCPPSSRRRPDPIAWNVTVLGGGASKAGGLAGRSAGSFVVRGACRSRRSRGRPPARGAAGRGRGEEQPPRPVPARSSCGPRSVPAPCAPRRRSPPSVRTRGEMRGEGRSHFTAASCPPTRGLRPAPRRPLQQRASQGRAPRRLAAPEPGRGPPAFRWSLHGPLPWSRGLRSRASTSPSPTRASGRRPQAPDRSSSSVARAGSL